MERLYYWLQLNRAPMMVVLAVVALCSMIVVHAGAIKGVAEGVLTAAALYPAGFGRYRFKRSGKHS